MSRSSISFSVFTKPWRRESIDELGAFISGLGFDGIEFPLRDGYQVEPQNAEAGLPRLVERLAGYNLQVYSVASVPEEGVFAACAASGVPVIRIMGEFDARRNYLECEAQLRSRLDALVPLCEKYGVKIGVQHHYGYGVSNSMELLHLIEPFDPRHIGAIWDAGHSGLAGDDPKKGLDIVWSHLFMVNLKNAYYRRMNGSEASQAKWERYFTTGPHGLSNWAEVAHVLKERGYNGVVCLTAEYAAEERVNELIEQDIAFARSLFDE